MLKKRIVKGSFENLYFIKDEGLNVFWKGSKVKVETKCIFKGDKYYEFLLIW